MALHGHPEQLGESGASLYSIITLCLFIAHATAIANTTPVQQSLPKQCQGHCALVYLSVYLSMRLMTYLTCYLSSLSLFPTSLLFCLLCLLFHIIFSFFVYSS